MRQEGVTLVAKFPAGSKATKMKTVKGMNVKEFYSDKKIQSALGKYLNAADVDERFAKSVADLSSEECLIPVLGTQGAGKSSFLNAVLFGDILLPVDADETTCIPTAVRYGGNEDAEAFVVLSTGERRKVECSEKGLADYVHQEKNPGNEKGVSHIEIIVKNPLLKDGIVFVDLPGVGSITAANQKTTVEYLRKCAAAIFMLRTVPPITQSESVFIQGALPLMGRVFWVQNQWTDESNDEVCEGRAHNYNVLKKIAESLKMPDSTIVQPDVVCVKKALDGRIRDDAKMVADSGVDEFRKRVVQFATDWRKDVFAGKKAQALALLSAGVGAGKEKVSQLEGEAAEERKKALEAKKAADATLANNIKLTRQARDFLFERRRALTELIRSECQKFVENLRNGVRQSIDAGLVGGEQLNHAFNDYVKRGNEELFQSIQPEFVETGAQLPQILSGLEACGGLKTACQLGVRGQTFSEKTKAHETYGSIGSVAGGIGGFCGGIWAGGEVGAMVGSAICPAVGTVVGTAVGLVVGCAGSLLGALFGNTARDVQVESQQETARGELFAAAEKLQKKAQTKYEAVVQGFVSEAESSIHDWLRSQKDSVDKQFRTLIGDLEKPVAEKARLVDEIKCDIQMFETIAAEME